MNKFEMPKFKDVFEREEDTIKFWKENKIFEKSVEQRPKDNPYSFYDGPPFVTGLPHYGHLLGTIAKDVYPRYQTMKGKRVRRVWGWDCHGLPVENAVEKKLGLKNRRDIEKIGLKKFVAECRTYVSETSAEWDWYVDHIGRWVDMENAYRTMDLDYMESVIWAFKQLYDKGLIYKGFRVSLFCPRCSTPISKFEIDMDNSYKDVEDISVTVKFRVKGKKNLSILAWTTTPWTLPANTALAVGEDIKYVEIEVENEHYILALALKDKRFPDLEIVKEYTGKDLVDWEYERLFDQVTVDPKKKGFRVIATDFVTTEDGTGVVHMAPGFGEEDTEAGKEHNLPMIVNVDDEGNYTPDMGEWAGVYIKDANNLVIDDLEKRSLLLDRAKYTHSYPFCWRCETPLIYRAQDSWFINVQELKVKLLDTNENIDWVPEHFKHGRFKKTLEVAPDWGISRTRYWATAMPVWECTKCDEIEVFGSVKEIEDRSGMKVDDLHRPKIDEVKFGCKKCAGEMHRISDVLDCWMESGSMPYAEHHYPFENKERFEKAYPADFISEYTGQIRAWFYYLHVLSTALFNTECFKNVVVSGVMAGDDGRKMSKSFGNYPDPRGLFEKYGADALRYVLMASPLMMGGDTTAAILEPECEEMTKKVLIPLTNSVRFLSIYAEMHDWTPDRYNGSENIMDQWIFTRTDKFAKEMENHLEAYNTPKAVKLISPYLEDLSAWYIRRSRNRFADGDKVAMQTLHHSLLRFIKTTAPIIPFVTESMFRVLNTRDTESVHLCLWPEIDEVDEQILIDMEEARRVVTLGQSARVESKMKVRQPLAELQVTGVKLSDELIQVIADELNVEQVTIVDKVKKSKGWVVKDEVGLKVSLNTNLTDDLKKEGLLREIVRTIQALRKKSGFQMGEKIKLYWQSDSVEVQEVFESMVEQLMKTVGAESVVNEEREEMKEKVVNEYVVKVRVEK